MKKVFLLSLLLPLSLNAVAPLSMVKLGGAMLAGTVSVVTGRVATAFWQESKGSKMKNSDIFFAAPWALASIASGVLAVCALSSAFDYELQFPLKNIRIK